MAAIGKDLKAQLPPKFFLGPFRYICWNVFREPNMRRADGGGLEDTPVTECVFPNVSAAHITALL